MTSFANSQAAIAHELDWMERVQADTVGRYECSREAGGDLAATVYAFVTDPKGVGTDRLREAYDAYMGLHAGNFYREKTAA